MITATAHRLLTAAEYAQIPDRGIPTELVRGRVIEMNVPAPRHGEICSKVDRLVGNYADDHGLGRVVINDSGVITEHNPDTVRGADVAFYSFARVPQGPLPAGYLDVVPELVFEVRSPTDRWPRLLAKAGEYLEAGVSVVCLLDQMSERVLVCRADELPWTLHGDDELHLPDILGDFRVPVRRFFE
ncbi:MAG TPA: Uma2 family endonuclease [Gemmataceae bacterium]|nr:Uma2 family endonuclease [Gemmataceae bacterium]